MKDGYWGLIFCDTASVASGFMYDRIKSVNIKINRRKRLVNCTTAVTTKLLCGLNYKTDSYGEHYDNYWLLFTDGKVFPYDDCAKMIHPRGFDNIYGIVRYGLSEKDVCFIVEDNYKKGLLRTDGQIICRCEFDEIKRKHSVNHV